LSSNRLESLVVVYTGPGKGKTTAALGMVTRALGWGLKPAVVQYVKGKWRTGERQYFEKHPDVVFEVMGKGFTWESDDLSVDKQAAQKAWARSSELIMSGEHAVVVLDEITYVINYGFISCEEVVEVLQTKPDSVTVVVTGRKCPAEIVAVADLVTEMKDEKHPYHKGYKAARGVDF